MLYQSLSRCKPTYLVDGNSVHVVLQRESREFASGEFSQLVSFRLWNSSHAKLPISNSLGRLFTIRCKEPPLCHNAQLVGSPGRMSSRQGQVEVD
jgi:hypothetical protein